jgi:hypothetical protein
MGQLIAEAIRSYGDNFWRALPLGLPLAIIDQFSVGQPLAVQVVIYWLGGPLIVVAFIRACSIVYGVSANRTGLLVALAVYALFPPLRAIYLLPGVAWFAFIGLAVPAALVERLGFRAALARGRELGTADFAHSFGSLAALVLVVGIADNTLITLLHSQSEASERVALGLSDLVLSPLLYLGGALLYADQAARVRSPRPDGRRRRNADLHPPLDADPARRSDPEGPS